MVVRAGDAHIPVGNIVILADECGAATLTQDLGEHRWLKSFTDAQIKTMTDFIASQVAAGRN